MEAGRAYPEVLQALRTGSVTVGNGPGAIEMKPVPDPVPGHALDPRVFKVIGGQRFRPMLPAGAEGRTVDHAALDIAAIRSSMGWPNIDVAAGRIRAEERVIPGTSAAITVRIYSAGLDRMPAIVYLHGGAFIGGSLRTVENPCKALAERAGAVVVSVDYRLAPEHRFEAGLTDCFDAVTWVSVNARELRVDPARIAVAGDSAGANLGAACAIMDRDRKTRMIALQALIYPVVDLACTPNREYTWSLSDYDAREDRPLIEEMLRTARSDQERLHAVYLAGGDPADPLVSPLFVADATGLARALILTAEFDALRPEGEAYAHLLARSSVPTKCIRYQGMDHAFLDKIGLYPQAEDCVQEIAAEVGRLHAAE